jgi:protein-S-isoprenylcysteine O-methyltransferase Ste14
MKDAVVDWGERLVLLLLFASFAVANIHSEDLLNWAMVAMEGITAFLVLIRRRAISVSERPSDWALAMAGTMIPLLIRPRTGGEAIFAGATFLATGLVIVGTCISFLAKMSLNRRMAIAPANRGVQAKWAYAVVRHPMYAGYVVAQAGYLIHNPSWANAAIYLCAWAFQGARIVREERHLSLDQEYRAYMRQTPFRLIPGVF